MNSTIATITSIAEERDRPVSGPVSTVADAPVLHRGRGPRSRAIDVKASSMDDLLLQADSMTVNVAGEPVRAEVTTRPPHRHEPVPSRSCTC